MKTLRTFFTVIISLAFLTTYAQGDISGTILYHSEDGAPLPEVELQLFNADGEYVATSFTNDEGEYLFEDLEIGDYYIEASYDAEAGGATMQDAVMIMLHLMGVHELEGIEYLAADVDADGEITWDDHALVLLHFFTGEPFPAGDWVFEDIEHNIGDKEGGDDGDGGGNDNLGSSAGDVDGTWEPGQRDRRIAEAVYTPHSLVPQENTTLSVTASNNMTLTGAGIVIQYPASLVDVSNVTTPLQDAEVRIQNGQIMLAWNSANSVTLNKGEELLTMETTLLSETGETIRFTLGQKTSFAGENGSPVKNAKLNLPEMKQSQAMKINSLAPNPVFHEATLNFYMNRGGTAKVSLTDLSGKKVRTIESSHFSQGVHEVTLTRDGLQPGVYILQLQSGESLLSKKLIIK